MRGGRIGGYLAPSRKFSFDCEEANLQWCIDVSLEERLRSVLLFFFFTIDFA